MIALSSESHRTEEEGHGMRGEKTFVQPDNLASPTSSHPRSHACAQPRWVQNSPSCAVQTHSFPTANHHNAQHLLSRFLTSIASYLHTPLATTTTTHFPFLPAVFQSHDDGDMKQDYARSDASSSRSSSATANHVDLAQRRTALRKKTGRIDADDMARLDQMGTKQTNTRKRLRTFDILPDDVLRCILQHALAPVVINGRQRYTIASINTAARLAAVHPRFHTLLHALLTDVDLSLPQLAPHCYRPSSPFISPSSTSSLPFLPSSSSSSSSSSSLTSETVAHGDIEDRDEGQGELSAVWRIASATVQRLYLRKRADKQNALLRAIHSCTRLKTLDLSFHSSVNDNFLHSLISSSSPPFHSRKRSSMTLTLQTLLLRGCRAVSADVLVQFVTHFRCLSVIDISAIPGVTDAAVQRIITAHVRSLRIFAVSHCPRVTDLSLQFISQLSTNNRRADEYHHKKSATETKSQRRTNWALTLDALFLRSTCVSDHGVEALLRDNQPLANSLQTVDLVDCPRVTNRSFTALYTYCPAIRDRIDAHNGISLDRPPLSNALLLLDDYIMPITSNHLRQHTHTHEQSSTTTCVVLADAATAPALEAALLAHRTFKHHHHESRLLANSTFPSPSPTYPQNDNRDDFRHIMYTKFGIRL